MAKLTKEEKQEIEEQIEECIDNILGNIDLDRLDAAAEYIKKEVEDHIDYLLAMQKMIQA